MLGASFNLEVFRDIKEAITSNATVAMLDLSQGGTPLLALGRPNLESGQMAAESLAKCIRLAMEGWVDGMVYPPLCKETLHLGNKKYNDERHLFQELLGTPSLKSVSKAGEVFGVSVTGHVPLRDVAHLITEESILESIQVLQKVLLLCGLDSPHIGVAALNPHAGERGLVGREEVDRIAPAIQKARTENINASGPVPADTIYVRALKREFDGVVNLYHDQAHIALKLTSFGQVITFFVGSPVTIATTGHGTAYDIAGRGIADEKNLLRAIEFAAFLANKKASGKMSKTTN
jgi:4-hydroxythreonine-4-phosphate dehydrogenase